MLNFNLRLPDFESITVDPIAPLRDSSLKIIRFFFETTAGPETFIWFIVFRVLSLKLLIEDLNFGKQSGCFDVLFWSPFFSSNADSGRN